LSNFFAAIASDVRQTLAESASAASAHWRALSLGELKDPALRSLGRRAPGSKRPGASTVLDVGVENPEHPAASHGSGNRKLQHKLLKFISIVHA
jgi:hypothetical protein